MKHLLLLLVFLFTITASAQAPTKLFDIRNGDGIVDGGVVQPQAMYIVFKDAAAKTTVIDALCDLGNYSALNPATRPNRAAFARNEIKNFLRAKVQENRQRVERAKYIEPDASDLP